MNFNPDKKTTLQRLKEVLVESGFEYYVESTDTNLVSLRIWVESKEMESVTIESGN